MIALIDGDILAYQAAAYAEKPVNWGDGLWTLHAFEEDAEVAFQNHLDSIMGKTGAEKCLIAFSDKENWRKEVLNTYKANRSDVRKPMLLKHLRDWAAQKWECTTVPKLEGDDVLGIKATTPGDWIVCSIDKDFKTIPGKHYNFGRDEFFEITPEEADYWHMAQTLTGDATDNYGGCPGVGPKTAEKILADKEDLWSAVIAAYIKAGLSEEEAITQAQVARILRAGEYDFDTGAVKLWHPEKA